MPNWVYNSVEITGSKDDLLAFIEKAKQQHKTFWRSDKWITMPDGTRKEIPDEERVIVEELSGENDLSFWNFVRPTDEELPYYFEHLKDPTEKNENDLFAGSHWYNWNLRNWGVKWDTGDTELTDNTSDPSPSIRYRYDTAWSIPVEVMTAMVAQHPTLDFEFYSEEEQGWGAKFSGSGGELSETSSWDIPDSHADYVALDREDSCICGNDDDEESWYSDCPTSPKPYKVKIRVEKEVSAKTPEQAYEIAIKEFESYELGEIGVNVFDETGNKVYPVL